MQPSQGGTKPGLFREIMETGMSLDRSEDRGSGQGLWSDLTRGNWTQDEGTITGLSRNAESRGFGTDLLLSPTMR